MYPLLYRFILSTGRQLYRKIFNPTTQGVKVIIRCNNEILLIKNTYGSNKWNLPGGGIKRNESLENAAKREIKEEVGIELGKITKLGSFLNTSEHIKDTVTVFSSNLSHKNTIIDKKEVQEVQWFPLSKIPKTHLCTGTLLQSLRVAKIKYK